MPGQVLYRRDGTWIDVDPDEKEKFMASGEYSDSPAGPWREAPEGGVTTLSKSVMKRKKAQQRII